MTMAPHSARRVLNRIVRAEAQGLSDYKTKVYQLRGICAGAKEFFNSTSAGDSQDYGSGMFDPANTLRPDIMVKDFMEGKSNDMLNLLNALALKVTLKDPDVFLEGVDPTVQKINTEYLRARLGPYIKGGCSWGPENRALVMDDLMGGVGCVYLPADDGDSKPGWRWADTLQLIWDQTARLPSQVTWMAICVSKPLWYWQKMFPDAAVLGQRVGAPSRIADLESEEYLDDDKPTKLVFYYDIEGKGHLFAFLVNGDNVYEPEPVYEGANPHTFDVMGAKKPFLPFRTAFFISLPGVRLPIGVAEKMLPAYMGILRAITMINEIIDRGSAFYLADADGFESEDAKKKFMESGDPGNIVWVKDGKVAVKVTQPLEIPVSVGEELRRNLSALKESVGTSNAVTGQGTPSPGGGKMTAREFAAIEGQSQLTAASVASDVTGLMEEGVNMFLWNAKNFDRAPFTCRVGKTVYEFGPKGKMGPVGDYLRPDAWVTINEDSMSHIPHAQKIAESKDNLQVAMSVAQVLGPQPTSVAYREYLELKNLNPAEYLPAAPAGQAGAPQ